MDQDGIATIIDFKTGAAPTKQEVYSGLSPQLIVEAIILSEGGFSINCQQVKNLAYVKIASNHPYIRTSLITITPSDIAQHKQGLLELLEHYITTLEFPIEYNIMKYDDYKHLARRFGVH